jgi:hypothetical protein
MFIGNVNLNLMFEIEFYKLKIGSNNLKGHRGYHIFMFSSSNYSIENSYDGYTVTFWYFGTPVFVLVDYPI